MRIKFSNKTKAYWLNYFGYWLIFSLFSAIISTTSANEGESIKFGFKYGFMVASIVSSFVLAHMIAKKYSKNEEIEELRVKEGLNHKDFNSKYGSLFKIYDK